MVAEVLIPAGVNLLNNIISNRKKHRAQPMQQQQQSGVNALLPNQKAGVSQVSGLVNQAINPYQEELLRKYGLTPEHPLYSEALAYLQSQNPEEGILPAGAVAEPHRLNVGAYNEIEQNDYSPEGLAQYMQPYNAERSAMETALNKGFDQRANQIRDEQAKLGSRIRPGTNEVFQKRLDALEGERANSIAGIAGFLENRGQNTARDIRKESLALRQGAGQDIRNYQQEQLNSANGYGRFINNPNVGQGLAFNQFISPYLNASSGSQTGARPGTTNVLGQTLGALAGGINTYYGNQQQNMGQGMGQSMDTPWNRQNPYGNTVGQHFGGY